MTELLTPEAAPAALPAAEAEGALPAAGRPSDQAAEEPRTAMPVDVRGGSSGGGCDRRRSQRRPEREPTSRDVFAESPGSATRALRVATNWSAPPELETEPSTAFEWS
jgi:hypothetical protein